MRARGLILLTLLLLAPLAHAARILDRHSLDSLVYNSPTIVRVEIGQPKIVPTQHYESISLFHVTVQKSFAGDQHEGDAFDVAGLEDYWRTRDVDADNSDGTWQALGENDVAYLFLAPRGKGIYSKYGEAPCDLTVFA